MIDSIKNISFTDIETLIQQISRTEFALLDHLTAQMQVDLELIKILEKLKVELTNLISVK
jgi:hypothetical protein